MKAGQQRVQPEPQAEDPFGLSAWATSQREADVQTMTGRDLLLGTAFHLSTGGDGAERAGPGFTTWGRVATGGFEADVSDPGEGPRRHRRGHDHRHGRGWTPSGTVRSLASCSRTA